MAEQHDETESSSNPEKPGAETEQPETEAAETEAADSADRVEPAVPKKKKKKRAVDVEAEPIRDRNRRLREAAASKRKTKLDDRRAPARSLEAGEIVDDALARSTQAAGEWLKKHFNVVQWFIIAGLVGWIGYAVYRYRTNRAAEQASAKLTAAIRAEDARVGAEDNKPDPQTGIVDTRPTYPTDAARLKAAEQQYRALADANTVNAASTLAKLGLASVLYDQGKYADAKTAYQAVKDSKLAGQDPDVKGRALEGIGMCLESLKDTDGADKAFGELANIDALGFGALGAYHQARIAFAANNPEKAKQLLQDAQKKLEANPDAKKTLGAPGYLQQAVRDLLKQVDPTAVTANPSALTADQLQELQDQMGSGSDGKGMSSEKLQELLRNLSKKAPAAPAPPASAP
ncbi:MAG TPA: tetratricopeptide repeat protein [Polyangiaceae bacterium]|nr:tetratricopeptide repeat protein [Polyangiaceae bacterium]